MRIGLVTEYYYPSVGGVQEHVHHFAREARRAGHEVRIVTSEMPEVERNGPDAPGVIRVGRSLPLYSNGGFGRVSVGAGLSAAVRDVLARERFDVVHVHCPLTPVLPWLALHHARGPVVGTFHTHFSPGPLWGLTRRWQQRYADRLDAAVAVSRAATTAYAGRLELPFRVIPNGVDVERFGAGRRLAALHRGRFTVLFVGRLEPRNGLDLLLEAFARLRARADTRLLVVGGGPLRERYEARVPERLRPDVHFAGVLHDERPDWYASADVYCAPTRIASFGVTLLEAMAAGRPVLASDIDGFREVMTDGREGRLLPQDDPAAWADALEQLAADPARARRLGEGGRATARRYDWPLVAAEVLELYRSIGVRA